MDQGAVMSQFLIPLVLGIGLFTGRTMLRRQIAGGIFLVIVCVVLALTLFVWRCSKPASPLLRTGLDNAALLHQAEGEAIGDWLVEHFPDARILILAGDRQETNPGVTTLKKRLGPESALHVLHRTGPMEDDTGPRITEDVEAQIHQHLKGREVVVFTAHHALAQRVWKNLPAEDRPALCFIFVDPIILPSLFQQRVLTAATIYHATPEEQAAIRNDPRHTQEQARRLIRVLTAESVFDAVTW